MENVDSRDAVPPVAGRRRLLGSETASVPHLGDPDLKQVPDDVGNEIGRDAWRESRSSKTSQEVGTRPRFQLIPVIVAGPLFLQNLDTSILATALPAMAHSLDVETLHLNFAITAYLLSLAIFLPASGWLADRLGTRSVFCGAIALFSVASGLCGLATSVPQLVLFRILQGIGGAMMVPVGRLILLRSVPPSDMVTAMVWFTMPGAIGRILGPLLGGFLVTVASWRWIFFLNVPFGILFIILTMRFVTDTHERSDERFDLVGFILIAVGLVGVMGGLDTIGRNLVPLPVTIGLAGAGVLSSLAYGIYSSGRIDVVIPLRLLLFKAYRTAVVGGMPLRIAVGASPFLLPLLLQLGFGLSPLASGLLSVATAVGSLGVRFVMQGAIRRVGFRPLLIAATVLTATLYGCYGLLTRETSHAVIFAVLLLGGLFNSLALVIVNTLGFSDMPTQFMSKATALSTMMAQTSISAGVALSASLLTLTAHLHGRSAAQLSAVDFPACFFLVGALTLVSLGFFLGLRRDEGAEFT